MADTKKKTSSKSDAKKKTSSKSDAKKKTSSKGQQQGEKKSPPVIRSRSWNLILYPDCESHMDILYYLTGDNPESIQGFYIFHKGEIELTENGEKVLDENGNIKYKKDHYHVTITYKNARTITSVVKAFCNQISKACIEATSDINSTYLYMLHRTYDCFSHGKTVYKHSDVKPLGNGSAEYLANVSGLKNDTVSTFSNLFECAKCAANAPDMLQIVIDNFGERELKTLVKNAYFVKTFMLGGK